MENEEKEEPIGYGGFLVCVGTGWSLTERCGTERLREMVWGGEGMAGN